MPVGRGQGAAGNLRHQGMGVGQAQLRIASADGVGQFDGGPGVGNSRAAAGQDLFLHPCVQIGAATRELDFLTVTSLRAVSIAA